MSSFNGCVIYSLILFLHFLLSGALCWDGSLGCFWSVATQFRMDWISWCFSDTYNPCRKFLGASWTLPRYFLSNCTCSYLRAYIELMIRSNFSCTTPGAYQLILSLNWHENIIWVSQALNRPIPTQTEPNHTIPLGTTQNWYASHTILTRTAQS